jgi:hypothetical protein
LEVTWLIDVAKRMKRISIVGTVYGEGYFCLPEDRPKSSRWLGSKAKALCPPLPSSALLCLLALGVVA